VGLPEQPASLVPWPAGGLEFLGELRVAVGEAPVVIDQSDAFDQGGPPVGGGAPHSGMRARTAFTNSS